ncbi:MAG: right-handed parallel beta-helix repeat-containing protein [Planctomycetes bacterium]|nr:right-handed parallel beta-helix repeat-containing protein [Planctomycetota bacterium]
MKTTSLCRTSYLFLPFCVASLPAAHAGTVWYVDADATVASHDGASWCSAFVHLQDALAIVSFGDEIRVANGTYRPDLGGGQTLGDRESSFYLVRGVSLRGGYPGCGASNPDDRDIGIYETVLSGDLDDDDGPDFLNYNENSYHVVANDDPSTSAQNTILDGFTVSHGYADGPNFGPSPESKDQGAGVNLYYGPVTLTFCTFRDNFASNHGNVNDHAGAVITQCEFRQNKSEGWGGGLFIAPGINTLVQNTAFMNNHTNGALGGGGAVVVGGDAQFTNCDFSNNTSYAAGGGLYIHSGARPTLTKCTLSRNVAYFDGGGMYCEFSQPTILQTDFVDNWAHLVEAADGGGGIFFVQSDPYLSDCKFSGNSVAVVGIAGRGGGIYSVQSALTIRKSVFDTNQGGDGGGLFVASWSVRLFNCKLFANTGSSGSAIYCSNSADCEMVNCMFVANHGQAGTIFSYGSDGESTFVNCTVFGNTANATDRAGIFQGAGRHTNVYNTIAWGNGNGQASAQIFVGDGTTLDLQNSLVQAGSANPWSDPLFVNPAGADGTLGTDDDDLRIGPGSPAIGAGNNALLPPDSVDLDDDGNEDERIPIDLYDFERIGGEVVDIGAIEFGSRLAVPSASAWGLTVMLLLVGTAGTLVIRRRSEVKAPVSA